MEWGILNSSHIAALTIAGVTLYLIVRASCNAVGRRRLQRRTEARLAWKRIDDPTWGEMHHLPGEAVRTMHKAGIGCCPLGRQTNGVTEPTFPEEYRGEPSATDGNHSSAPPRSPGRASGRSR